MSTITATRDEVAAALGIVRQVSLEQISAKLRHEDPAFWTDEVIAQTELDYRRFLALNVLNPGVPLSLNKALDEYWHQHILDTHKYAADCEMVFGSFLHHDPYFGLEDEEEWQENVDQFAATQRLWKDTFGAGLLDKPELTLDKPLGTYQAESEDFPEPEDFPWRRVYSFPQSCKSGQHCQKIVGPERFDPVTRPPVRDVPEEPAEPVRKEQGDRQLR